VVAEHVNTGQLVAVHGDASGLGERDELAAVVARPLKHLLHGTRVVEALVQRQKRSGNEQNEEKRNENGWKRTEQSSVWIVH
jgi:hypothetical protein